MRSKRRLFCLLDFVLPVGNRMFLIANLLVDGGCIATIGDSSLFCILNISKFHLSLNVFRLFIFEFDFSPRLAAEKMGLLRPNFTSSDAK
jgi:hypothetical protein